MVKKKAKESTWKLTFEYLPKEVAEDYHNLYAEIDILAYEALGWIFPDLPDIRGELIYIGKELE